MNHGEVDSGQSGNLQSGAGKITDARMTLLVPSSHTLPNVNSLSTAIFCADLWVIMRLGGQVVSGKSEWEHSALRGTSEKV